MKKMFLLFLALPLFWACENDSSDYVKTYVRIGTVENPNQSTSFLLKQDDSITTKVVQNYVNYYRPKDKQRVILRYQILDEKPDSLPQKYDVRVYAVYEILTKDIFKITPQTEDSIGNEPIIIRDMWVANDHLNVEFSYYGYSKTHFINLVSDASNTSTDNKVHLEFRHNSNNDYPYYYTNGMVSFRLDSLKVDGQTKTDFVVHVNKYGSSGSTTTYDFTYKYGSNNVQQSAKMISDIERKAIFK